MRRRITIVFLVLIMLIGCSGLIYGVFVMSLGGFLGVGNGCPSSFPWKIEQNARFQLPSSYRNLESYCAFGQGWIAAAIFEMNPADLDTLIDSTSILRPLSTTGAPAEWLNSDEIHIENYLYGTAETSWQRVLIDTADPDVYRVYLRAAGGH